MTISAKPTIASMTGFAEARGAQGDTRWLWEIKTVNGRALELRLRLPPGHDALEPELRRLTQGRLARGSVQISLTLTREGATTQVKLNEAMLADIAKAFDRIRQVTGASPPTVDGVAAIRGVLETVEATDDEATLADRRVLLLESFAECLDGVVAARAAEGARLAVTLDEQIATIEALAADAQSSPARRPDRIAQRLKGQIDRLFEASGQFDPQRLHQEAMLLATKADIEEELQRLGSHIAAARALFSANEPVGRKLDFLAQEFNREANTLCSKASDAELTRIGLALKAVIDQWREQVQNVE
jgi:uncharacterized protein (TIGR00255 family)